MSSVEISGFLHDDENEDKYWDHGIVPEQIDDILANPHVIRRNRRNRRAPYMVVGVDRSGKCIAVPIEATYDPFIWRPVTAWYCKDSEAALLSR
jgi:hypothetical protein